MANFKPSNYSDTRVDLPSYLSDDSDLTEVPDLTHDSDVPGDDSDNAADSSSYSDACPETPTGYPYMPTIVTRRKSAPLETHFGSAGMVKPSRVRKHMLELRQSIPRELKVLSPIESMPTEVRCRCTILSRIH